MQHLPAPDFSLSDEKIAAEEKSIENQDLFGMSLYYGDSEIPPPANDARDNPFALFLYDLAENTDGVATFDMYSGRDFPIYRVCSDEAMLFAGQDVKLAEEILEGHVALQDMPKELRNNGSSEDQAAWVRKKVEEFRDEMRRRIEERKVSEASS